MTLPQYKYSRSQIREVECPNCYASAGRLCVGARGKTRESNHMERAHHYAEMREQLVNP